MKVGVLMRIALPAPSTTWYRAAMRLSAFFVLSVIAAGCAAPDDSAQPTPPNSDSSLPDAGADAPAWYPCATVTGEDDSTAECVEFSAPLRWNESAGQAIELFLKKLPATGETQGQLWMLSGGPGSSGVGVEPAAVALRAIAPNIEVMMLDHRGTGRSTRLGCARQEAADSPSGTTIADEEWPACLNDLQDRWAGSLDAFSVTEAARDLGQLIPEFAHSEVPVFVYGISYGTTLAQRYLQLYPAQPDGVIIDGIVSPSTTFATHDERMNEVGKLLMDTCEADASCRSRIGPNPRGQLEDLFEDLESGHCTALGSPDVVRSTLRQMMATVLDARGYRPLVPAIVARAQRCDAADQNALVHLLRALTTPSGDPADADASPPLRSTVLFLHIGLSELWPNPPPSETSLREITHSTEISSELSTRMAARRDGWPVYDVDDGHGAWAQTGIPMLMLNGELDGATPAEYAREVGEHYSAPHQHYVEIPWAPHGSLLASPLVEDPKQHCALQLLVDFMTDPKAAPRDRCAPDQLAPINFQGAPGLSEWAFDEASLWE